MTAACIVQNRNQQQLLGMEQSHVTDEATLLLDGWAKTNACTGARILCQHPRGRHMPRQLCAGQHAKSVPVPRSCANIPDVDTCLDSIAPGSRRSLYRCQDLVPVSQMSAHA